MILVDSSIWIDHLRISDSRLTALLNNDQVLVHPFIVGELALGSLRDRDGLLVSLISLPQAITASDEEVLTFINRHALFGLGIGYLDAHLLASAQLSAAQLWTRDKRLAVAATALHLSA